MSGLTRFERWIVMAMTQQLNQTNAIIAALIASPLVAPDACEALREVTRTADAHVGALQKLLDDDVARN